MAIVETASAQMESAAPSMAGVAPHLGTAVAMVMVAEPRLHPVQQEHAAMAIAEMASVLMESAAPSMAGVEPLLDTAAAAECCVG